MSLIDTHTHVSPAAARRGSIVAMCTITDDTVKSTVCVDKFGLFMIVSFVSPGGPHCGTVGFRFPGIPVSARARGSTSKRHAPLHTALPAPPPPTTTHETPPLAYPQYQTVYARSRGSRSAASRRTRLRPSRSARGRVGRRIQVQMQSVSRRPRQPTPRATVAARRAQAPGPAWGQS